MSEPTQAQIEAAVDAMLLCPEWEALLTRHDVYALAKAALIAAERAAWQDIATAPKDGTFLLTYADNVPGEGVAEGWWQGDKFYHPASIAKVTHWRPLPAPPDSEDKP